jgi:hypothetical protein
MLQDLLQRVPMQLELLTSLPFRQFAGQYATPDFAPQFHVRVHSWLPRGGVQLMTVIPSQALLTLPRVVSRAPRFSAVTQAPPAPRFSTGVYSRALWDWLRSELDQSIEDCSRQDGIRAYQLLDNLAVHFRERLLNHKSEPQANSFTISGRTQELMDKLERIFRILQQA